VAGVRAELHHQCSTYHMVHVDDAHQSLPLKPLGVVDRKEMMSSSFSLR